MTLVVFPVPNQGLLYLKEDRHSVDLLESSPVLLGEPRGLLLHIYPQGSRRDGER